jgi:hypothetical protein
VQHIKLILFRHLKPQTQLYKSEPLQSRQMRPKFVLKILCEDGSGYLSYYLSAGVECGFHALVGHRA